jgi:hypothetical protein
MRNLAGSFGSLESARESWRVRSALPDGSGNQPRKKTEAILRVQIIMAARNLRAKPAALKRHREAQK